MFQLSTQMMNLKRKVDQYKTVLANTRSYRATWIDELKVTITTELEKTAKELRIGTVR